MEDLLTKFKEQMIEFYHKIINSSFHLEHLEAYNCRKRFNGQNKKEC